MYRVELIYFIILAVIILFSQFLPTVLLLSLDNVIVRIFIVIILLYLIGIGPTAGIMGLVAVASMYLERNRRKIKVAYKKLELMEPAKHATVQEASQPQDTVHVNEFEKPKQKESNYMPQNRTEIFEPVSQTINEKHVLASMYPFKNSSELYEELGFGHINLD